MKMKDYLSEERHSGNYSLGGKICLTRARNFFWFDEKTEMTIEEFRKCDLTA